MATPSEITTLANTIHSKVAELDAYIKAENLPPPSLSLSQDTDAPPTFPLPPHLTQTKFDLLTALDELKCLVQGPLENLMEIFNFPHINTMPAIDAVTRYQIATKLDVREELSYAQLSARCGLHESDLRRLMRMLISVGLFAEPRRDVVAHNACSRVLQDDKMLSDWMAHVTKYVWGLSLSTVDVMSQHPDSQELEETAMYQCHGTTFWDSVRNSEEHARIFAASMAFLQYNPFFGSHHLVRDLEWDGKTCPKLMVDVGGHHGAIAADILHHYPVGKGIVQDVPEVVAAATVPEDLQGRLEFQAHDFFTPQPVQADVYLLRSVLLTWPDKYARKIISNLVPALKPGARIIINEMCLASLDGIPKPIGSAMCAYDLAMKQTFNSKQRNMEEWEALFKSCDESFKVSRVKTSPDSGLAVIEFVWE